MNPIIAFCKSRLHRLPEAYIEAFEALIAHTEGLERVLQTALAAHPDCFDTLELSEEDAAIARVRLAGDVACSKQPQFTRRLDIVVLSHAVRDGKSVLIVGAASEDEPSSINSLGTVTIGPAVLVTP